MIAVREAAQTAKAWKEMELETTRRNFIGAIASVAACGGATVLTSAIRDGRFEDIRVDRYYVLRGGRYGDTGGWGMPGYLQGPELVDSMAYWEYCRDLDDRLSRIERDGYYLVPSQYFGAPWKEFDSIPLTERWMREFYRRHRTHTRETWEELYDRYLQHVKSGKYAMETFEASPRNREE